MVGMYYSVLSVFTSTCISFLIFITSYRCIIVDSTRKGKSMPDALSKTVPIWIAVLNRLLFPDHLDECQLRTPEDFVSHSEHECINERIADFVAQAQSLQLDKQSLRAILRGKPLRPLWVTPDTEFSEPIPETDLNLVVLCTASGRTSSERSLVNYVQGAADDSESWALGLDTLTFWNHREQLLSTSEDELPAVIQALVSSSQAQPELREPLLVKPTSNLWISTNGGAVSYCQDFDLVISCSEQRSGILIQNIGTRYLHLSCATGKVGSRQLRSELPKLEQILDKISSSTRILVACLTGRDLAIGVALAVLCRCCLENGVLRSIDSDSDPIVLNKAAIKHRLSWIMVSMPDASPSRATLQSVNAFLLG
jgi:tRNA A64-2'-O-ribosylphosphate transferase